MAEVLTRPAERLPQTETLRPHEPLIGLQARMRIGGNALDSNNRNIPEVTASSFTNLDYGAYERLSIAERSEYWKKQGEMTFDQQQASWIEDTTNTFTSARAFFTKTEQGKDWAQALRRIGIQPESFSKDSATQLYTTYFAQEGGVQKFVDTTLAKYKTADGTFDTAALRKDLPALRWIAGIFGDTYAPEIIAQLTDALAAKPDTLAQEANQNERVNNIIPREVELLDALHPHVRQETTQQHPLTPPASPDTTPYVPPQPQANPQETREQNLSAEEIASALINYNTGEVQDTHIDLSSSVADLVDRALTILETEHARLTPENILLSDVAKIMIDKLNTHANSIGRELAFAIQGVALERNGKRLFVATHIVPTMRHTEAREINVDVNPEVFMENSTKLAANTNLDSLFYTLRQPSNGAQGAICHIHHSRLGPEWVAKPSQGDKNQVKSFLEEGHNPYRWGVITKTEDGQLHYNLIKSTQNTDGTISEESIHITTV